MTTIMTWGKQRNPDGTFKQIYPKDIDELLHSLPKIDFATVAERLGISKMTAYRRLRALGLYPKPHRIIPKEDLERLYVFERKSLREIAFIFKCDRELIKNRLRQYGIPIRNHKEATRLVADKLGARKHNHYNWRGGKTLLPYSPIKRSAHFWIVSRYGKPSRCEFNSNHKAYDWANISGHYRRERADWLRLCRSCHYWFDLPDVPLEKLKTLSPEHRYAYLQGRERRNGHGNSNDLEN
jgi:hypothetical protein